MTIDWPATLQAKGPARLSHAHVRRRPPPAGHATLHCLVLDCSSSMRKGERLALAKALLMAWSQQLARRRESLAIVTYSGRSAHMVLPPRTARPLNEAWIARLVGGGGTPVAQGLALADEMLARRRDTHPHEQTLLWLLSDVRFVAHPPRPRHADHCIVVDFDDGPLALQRAAVLARRWSADCMPARDMIRGPPAARRESRHSLETRS